MGQDIKLDGELYHLDELSAGDAFDLQPYIVPAAAHVIAAATRIADADMLGLVSLKEGEEEPDAETTIKMITELSPIFIAAIAGAFAELTPDKLRTVRKTLLGSLRCNGKEMFSAQGNTFDVLMRGRATVVWRLLFLALKMNYPDFFGLALVLKGAREKLSPSPQGSTPVTP